MNLRTSCTCKTMGGFFYMSYEHAIVFEIRARRALIIVFSKAEVAQ